MSPPCHRLYLFLDGELPPVDEENFRHHLARCGMCASGLHEAMQLELLGFQALHPEGLPLEEEAEEAPRFETSPAWPAPPWPKPAWHQRLRSVLPARRGPVGWWAAGAVALAAGLLVLVLAVPRARDTSPEVWVAHATQRALEARVSYSRADGYRPYVPMRAGPEAPVVTAPLPLRELAELEDRGDLHGIAAAYLVRRDVRQAADFLRRTPASLDRDSDLAVIALEQGRREDALEQLETVLRKSPDHPQALWNRALVLRELGLTLQAAEAFDAVVKLGEAGWSEEARVRSQALRSETLLRSRDFQDARAAARSLATLDGARLPLGEARRFPGVVRLSFYDAVRAAPTREAALRLLPLAEVLDEVQGGSTLRDTVHAVARADFQRRGPLARDYVRLLRGEHPSPDAYLETLRRSGEDDLYLGALVELDVVARHLEDFERIARAGGDPWLVLLAERELSVREEHAGEPWKAEQRLRAALAACSGRGLAYRCATLRRRLADLFVRLHRPADALEEARDGWRLTRELGEWNLEQQFLQEMAQISRLRHSAASARAFLRESLSRSPDDCEQRTYVHRNLASVAWSDFRPDEAREELEQATRCGSPLGMSGAWVLSNLARHGAEVRDEDLLRRTLGELRRGSRTEGELAALTFLEGQFKLERERAAGRELLHGAIDAAESLPKDVDARKTRVLAYGVLVSDAGRSGVQEQVLELMGRALRVSVPERCVLAVSVDHERTVTTVRDARGALVGVYDDRRSSPLHGTAEGLVPPRLVAALRGCEHVDVLALPPVHGLPGLLPADLAWSYRVGRTGPVPESRGQGGRHLVVTGVDAPQALGLEKLLPLEAPRVPDPLRVELRGAAATPSRVLREMAEAREIEIHTHGLFSSALSDSSLLVLAPDEDGRYVLSADQVREQPLVGAPLVLLAACGAARAAPFLHETVSLPVAFIDAGARTVLASTGDIPDTAGRFFESVRERIRAGAPASLALRDERLAWMAREPAATWPAQVLLFE
ncbi:CHAT domain-containing protein [Myxococcus llanfairpwllgwyngyllgogerychwyrndrobwllllantysiliogogogochensis]|uniref:CHAT domain-containing protein n=1 Tax=Myxococcus llanfairpwllgwyngyllgogerychwyrndrobwllllantysiliogogogochensis TaxID=2590453 RepID=A0A540WYJ4_9BACT|nr:CHAT domain-containing protein [Myxococcus llanfairpwllgwyngyllgogerychwyrndrobwllllantysiliogogogochensis]TQF14058.1 CHAT domain-containing protein [Myxococcus llanfairpwllgwyngyllgogerychwyrndrobwllllantysiliogogogochensis]